MSNKHKYRVVYNGYHLTSGLIPAIIKVEELEWPDGTYDETVSYQDNLDYVVAAIFEDGFLECGQNYIAANAILAIEACEVSVQPQQSPQQQQNRPANNQGGGKSRKRFKRGRRYSNDGGRQDTPTTEVKHDEKPDPSAPIVQPVHLTEGYDSTLVKPQSEGA